MARTARLVVPGVPHHVTQRGNRRQQTFFEAADYARYVELIAEGCSSAGVEVLAWCLMPNHVHLILVPHTPDGLVKALRLAHQRYTWVVNKRNGWKGYLWQGRFFSCPLDDAHLGFAARYVELNPQRARLVAEPEQWRWSSARGRIDGRGDRLVGAGPARARALRDIADWRAFLSLGIEEEQLARIRKHTASGTTWGHTTGDTHSGSKLESLNGTFPPECVSLR